MDQEAIERFARIVQWFMKDAERQLTAREMEMLYLRVIEGLGASAIAERLSLSTKTVDAHRGHIVSKVGMPPRELDFVFVKAYWVQVGREQAAPLIAVLPSIPIALSALEDASARMHELLADPKVRALTQPDKNTA